MIVDRHQPGAERARDELRAYGGEAEVFIGDIGNPETAKSLVDSTKERFGRIDILVNNVGGAFKLPGSGDMGWEKLRKISSGTSRIIFSHACGAAGQLPQSWLSKGLAPS